MPESRIVADDLDDLGDLGRIEARHHLVEQQQARPGGERAGELQALAAGDGEIGAHLVELARHADHAGHRFGLALAPACGRRCGSRRRP